MSTDAIMAYIAECGHIGRLEFQISIQCAPVLKGIKASNMVNVARGSLKAVKEALAGTEITAVTLAAGDRKEVLFLYRFPMLEALLADQEVRGFLKARGYERFDLASVLMGLKRKYTAYLCGEGEFPHELGVLLDYPVDDVEDFIRCGGENCLFTGYWKVYHNPARAKAAFRRYDRAREAAMRQIVEGCPLREVAIRKENYHE